MENYHTLRRIKSSYKISQKKQVVEFAKIHGRNEAGRQFNLEPTMIGRWMKSSEKWDESVKNETKALGSGRKAFFPEAEEKLYEWVIEQRKQAFAVTYYNILNQMQKILNEPYFKFIYPGASSSFKYSKTWLFGFLRHKNLSLRRQTKISQKLPEQLHYQLKSFNKYIIKKRLEFNYELYNIYNMDETPVYFDMSRGLTINPKGEKTIHIKNTGNEKNRFTVVLMCTGGNLIITIFYLV